FFLPEEDRPGDPHHVMVLSYAAWQRRFSAGAGVVGRELQINRGTFTVIGGAGKEVRSTTVMAPAARVPIAGLPALMPGSNLLTSRASCWMLAIGRLKPGVTTAQARSEIATLGEQLVKEHPAENAERTFSVYPSRLFPGELQGYVAAFLSLLLAIV